LSIVRTADDVKQIQSIIQKQGKDIRVIA